MVGPRAGVMNSPAENERRPVRDVDMEPQRTFLDTRYPRSIEGIIRLISVPMALIGIILAAFGHSAGVFFLFVGVSFVIYVGMVFIVEVCVPGVFVHRLVDAIVSITFSLLWFVASIIVTVYASKWEVPALGGAAFFGFVLVVLTAASAFFAFRTRMKYGDGRKGSEPILAI